MRLLVRLWTALRAAGTFWKTQSPLTLIHRQSALDSLQFLKTLKDTSLSFSFLWVDEVAGRQIFQLAQLKRGDCVGVAKVFPLFSNWSRFMSDLADTAAALIPVMSIQRSVWNRSCCTAWAVTQGLLLKTLRLEMFHHITHKEEENSIPDFIQMFYPFKA